MFYWETLCLQHAPPTKTLLQTKNNYNNKQKMLMEPKALNQLPDSPDSNLIELVQNLPPTILDSLIISSLFRLISVYCSIWLAKRQIFFSGDVCQYLQMKDNVSKYVFQVCKGNCMLSFSFTDNPFGSVRRECL